MFFFAFGVCSVNRVSCVRVYVSLNSLMLLLLLYRPAAHKHNVNARRGITEDRIDVESSVSITTVYSPSVSVPL